MTDEDSAEFGDTGGSTTLDVHGYSISAFTSLPGSARNAAVFVLLAPLLIFLIIVLYVSRPFSGDESYPVEGTGSGQSVEGTGSGYGGDPGSAPEEVAPDPSSVAASPSSTVADAATQAAAFDQLVGQAVSDHDQVSAAVADIQACGDGIQADVSVLDQAAQSRSALADQVEQADVSQIASGADAARSLTAALRESAEADRAFSAWGSDMAGKCSSRSNLKNSHYKRAISIGERATAYKEQFALVWNPIAAGYGLAQREPSTL